MALETQGSPLRIGQHWANCLDTFGVARLRCHVRNKFYNGFTNMKIIGPSLWKKLSAAAGLVFSGTVLLAASTVAATTNNLAVMVAQMDRARILKLANEAMEQKPPAITDEVATNSAGGPHDFFSQADYSWPNPKTKNHLPY